jgi:hypothetical protein
VLLMMARQAVVAERCLSVGETAAAPSIGVARASSALRLGLHRLLARCRRFGVVEPEIVRSRSSRRLGLELEVMLRAGKPVFLCGRTFAVGSLAVGHGCLFTLFWDGAMLEYRGVEVDLLADEGRARQQRRNSYLHIELSL